MFGRSRIRHMAMVLTVALVAGVIAGAVVPVATSKTVAPAQAASAAAFDAGNIIDDSVFFDSNTMTTSQIQTFLNSKVPRCRSGYTCLKSYRVTTSTRSADAYCSGKYVGAKSQSAATIISGVAKACDVNPQVLIVLLQKEQGLVTDTYPVARQYRSATGYGCPDTAPCDSLYYGLFNQLYMAARQFQKYVKNPTYYSHRAGRTENILYSPKSSCGRKSVFVQNSATAALYNYTPYTPNQAALNAGYGSGDSCSAYGNRNFFLYFSDWFGSPVGAIVKASGSTTSYLLGADGKKHKIVDAASLSALRPLGRATRTVSASYLNGVKAGNDATSIIKNVADGAIYHVASGIRYHFKTCGQMTGLGTSCGAAVPVSSQSTTIFKAGPVLADLVRASNAPTLYVAKNLTKNIVTSTAALKAHYSKGVPAVFTSTPAELASLDRGTIIARTASVLTNSSTGRLYLVNGDNTFSPLASETAAENLGATFNTVSVSNYWMLSSQLANLPTPINAQVQCGTTTYLALDGTLVKLKNPSSTGLPTATLKPTVCSALKYSSDTVGDRIFVRTASTAPTFEVSGGVLHQLATPAIAMQRNGGTAPVVLPITSRAFASFKTGTAYFEDGSLVRMNDSINVYLIQGTSKLWMPSWLLAADLGLARPKKVPVFTPTSDDALKTGAAVSNVIRCGAKYYVAGSAKFAETTKTPTGLKYVSLNKAVCDRLPLQNARAAGSHLFVMSKASGPRLYAVLSGKKVHVTTRAAVLKLNKGVWPKVVLTLQSYDFNAIPTGTPLR